MFFSDENYQILEPVRITSKVDRTVYLTNSATNLFKIHLDDGKFFCAQQRSMRTQILNDYYTETNETEYPSYFVSYGVFAPYHGIQKLIDDTISFHQKNGFKIEKMRLRVSTNERTFHDYINASELYNQVTLDPKDYKFNHQYGGGLYGRAIKLDYYQQGIQRYKNLGYFIVMYRGSEIVGAEYASSDQLLLMRMYEIKYGIAASAIADILGTDTFSQRRFADCIVGCSHLFYEGIRPNSSNTNGRTLKKYMAALSYFGRLINMPMEGIPQIIDKYLTLEYGDQYVRSNDMFNTLLKNISILCKKNLGEV